MHHSFFTAALLIVACKMAQAQDTNSLAQPTSTDTPPAAPATPPVTPAAPVTPAPVTPAPVTPAPVTPAPGTPAAPVTPGNPPSTNPFAGATPLDGKTACSSTFFPLSQRTIAEIAQMDDNSGNPKSKPAVDPQTLSDVPVFAMCGQEKFTAICQLDSCGDKTVPPFPKCDKCFELTYKDANDPGTIGTVVHDSVKCNINYTFNSTDTLTPHICSNSAQSNTTTLATSQVVSTTYSCGSCDEPAVVCGTCYDPEKLPSKP